MNTLSTCRPITMQKFSASTKIHSTKLSALSLPTRKCNFSFRSRNRATLQGDYIRHKMHFVWLLLIVFIDWATGKLTHNHVWFMKIVYLRGLSRPRNKTG